MFKKKLSFYFVFIAVNLSSCAPLAFAQNYACTQYLPILLQAYPNFIDSYNIEENYIQLKGGEKLPIFDKNQATKSEEEKAIEPSICDQIAMRYTLGTPPNPSTYKPTNDPGRYRNYPFYGRLYGNTENGVMEKLTTVYWMPKHFGQQYPISITTVNEIDQRLVLVSQELDELLDTNPNKYKKFLEKPAGSFQWRVIANTNRLSPHSYGAAFDINPTETNYWLWDLQAEHTGMKITEDMNIPYHNNVPWEIVEVFEKYGFISGTKWKHYDTMHFEYAPHLLSAEEIEKVNQYFQNRKHLAYAM